MSDIADQIEHFIGTVNRYEDFWEALNTMQNESQGASIASGVSAKMLHLHIERHNVAMDAMRIGNPIAYSDRISESEARAIFKVMNACQRAEDICILWLESKDDLKCIVRKFRVEQATTNVGVATGKRRDAK